MGDEFCLQIIISLAIRLGLEGWIWGHPVPLKLSRGRKESFDFAHDLKNRFSVLSVAEQFIDAFTQPPLEFLKGS